MWFSERDAAKVVLMFVAMKKPSATINKAQE
jgi:hypothetical protein